MFNRNQTKQKKSDLISSPFGFHHLQHLGFNRESQQFDAVGLDDDLLQAFLDLTSLNEVVKTDSEKAFAKKYIKEAVGVEKFREAMQDHKAQCAPPQLPTRHFNQEAAPVTRNVPAPHSFPPKPKIRPPPGPTEIPSFRHNAQRQPPPNLLPPRSGSKSGRGGGDSAGVKAPAPPSRLDEISSFHKTKPEKIETEAAPTSPLRKENNSKPLEESLSDALSKLLSQGSIYLESDESDNSEST